jgi:hypothetical protein
MSFRNKKFTLELIFILATLCVMLIAEPCVAPVTTPANPSPAPVVTVTIDNNPIDSLPTYTTDPFTGEKQQISAGGKLPNGTITFTIQNRPFKPYTDKDGHQINVYYAVQRKVGSMWERPWCVYQSDSANTDIIFGYGSTGSNMGLPSGSVYGHGKQDYRVQAVMGHFDYDRSVFEGEGSEIIEFTIDIPSTNDARGISKPNIQPTAVVPSPSNSGTLSTSDTNTLPTSNPSNPSSHNPWTSTTNLFIIVLVVVCVITIPLVIIAYQYGKKKANFSTPNPSNTDNLSEEGRYA